MKKLVVLLFFPLITFGQALSGSYTVGSSQASPFNTLQNAVARIKSVGLSGPVVFRLDNNETVTAPIEITALSGSSATNTFTIKPAESKTITITANNLNSYTGIPGVIFINGASNIIIDGSNTTNGTSRDLTINNNNTINYTSQTVIWIASNGATGSSNVTVKNNILKNNARNQIGLWLLGVYSGGNSLGGNSALGMSTATGANSNTVISNNQFVNIRQAVYVNSSATTALKSANLSITDNIIGSTVNAEKPSLGFNLINVSGFTVQGNSLTNIYNPNSGDPNISAMIVDNCNDYTIRKNTITGYSHTINHIIGNVIVLKGNSNVNGNFIENVIHNAKNTGGGMIRAINVDVSSSANANLLIANNFIGDVTTTGTTTNNAIGIYIAQGKDIKLYYNTVALNTAQNNNSASLNIAAGSVFSIVNNIFYNSSTAGAPYAVYSSVSNSAFTTINYNDYAATNIGFLGSARATLAAWQSATGKDANSINETPVFVSSTDLHLATSNCTINGKGTPIANITNDIDSETRSTTTPDIGADEFTSITCCNSTTWNGTSWNNGAPTLALKAIINGNYSTATADINACELLVNANYTLTVTPNHYVKVQNNVTVNGNMIVETSGSLVQVDDAATATGSITVKRNSARMKLYDYSYWSAPVKNTTLAQLSPNTLGDKFYSYSALTNGYVLSQNGVAIMEPGKGYIVRAPQGWSASNETDGVYKASFTGVPNTGVIPVTIQKGTGSYNLIGNPYASAIDIDLFLTDPTNRNLVNGTIYVWTHNTAISSTIPGTQVYNYTSDDFAKYNLTGGVSTATAAISGGVVPNGKIASGQAFFVEAKTSLAAGTYTGNFNNGMRLTGNNSVFFRQSNNNPVHHIGIEKNRVWLSISNDQGGYNQALVGYITGASNDYDELFDGKTFASTNVLSLYSIVGTDNYSIQGRALPFTDTDVVSLGYKTTIAGTFTITADDFDGLFQNQNIYLVDKLNNMTHNLKNSAYSFTTAVGTFNDRFELRFTDAALAVETPMAIETGMTVYTKGKQVFIESSSTIHTVTIYDLLGRALFSDTSVNANHFESVPLAFANQVLIVKVKSNNNSENTKKVILK